MIKRRIILLGACLLLTGGAAIAWRMTRLTPVWYAPPNAAEASVIDLADRVEYRLVQEAQQVRPVDDSWTLRIREEQINAWLSARLKKWIERERGSSWPDQLGTPQVRIEQDGLNVAIPLMSGESSRFIVARINPEMDSGRLRVRLSSVALGRLSIPGAPLAILVNALGEALPALLPERKSADALDWLGSGEAIDPVFDLADDRRIRLIGVQLADGWIDLTARTLAEPHE
jgi:hypothetical protein